MLKKFVEILKKILENVGKLWVKIKTMFAKIGVWLT